MTVEPQLIPPLCNAKLITDSNDVYKQKITNLEGEIRFQETRWQLTEKQNYQMASDIQDLKRNLGELREREQLLTDQLNHCQQDRAKITALLKAQIRAVLTLLDDA